MRLFSYLKTKMIIFSIVLTWLLTESHTYAENIFQEQHFDLIRQFALPSNILLLPTYIPKDFDLLRFSLSENIDDGNTKSYSIRYENNHYLANHHFKDGMTPGLTLLFRLRGQITTLFPCKPAYTTVWNFRNPHMGRSTMCTEKLLRGFLSANNIRQTLNVTKITVISERMNIQVISTLVSQEELIKVLDSIQVIPKDMKKSISEPY